MVDLICFHFYPPHFGNFTFSLRRIFIHVFYSHLYLKDGSEERKNADIVAQRSKWRGCFLFLKGVFAKNERGYRVFKIISPSIKNFVIRPWNNVNISFCFGYRLY